MNLTRMPRLNGNDVAVTVISAPSSISSLSGFSKFGRVAASSCGGAWKYRCFEPLDKEGFLTCLERRNNARCP